jgi:hypothetical protein
MLDALIAFNVSQREMKRQFEAGPDTRRHKRNVSRGGIAAAFQSALRSAAATARSIIDAPRATTSTREHSRGRDQIV